MTPKAVRSKAKPGEHTPEIDRARSLFDWHNTKHTQEPWHTDGITIEARDSETPIAEVFSPETCGDDSIDLPALDEANVNAARIVACVNALADMDPAAIPALIEAAEACCTDDAKLLGSSVAEIDALRSALAAIKGAKQ